MNDPVNRKAILSTLWIFVMFNYLYADILMMIVSPAIYQRAAGVMTAGTVLGLSALMELLIAMPRLARVLPYRPNRWMNIIAGVTGTGFVAVTLVGHPPPYYVFFASLEIVCTVFIVWYAWTWRASGS